MSDSREIVRLALSFQNWEPDKLKDQPLLIRSALRDLETSLVAAKQIDPGAKDPKAKELVKAIGDIGIKINPTMNDDQTKRWAATIVKALSDLPYAVSVRAARDAIHSPIKFFSEIETEIREKAKPIQSRFDMARNRLERTLKLIAGASMPKLEVKTPPLSQDEIDAMQPEYQALGLRLGYLKRDADGRVINSPEERK